MLRLCQLLALLCTAVTVTADESIAQIRQVHQELRQGKFRINLHAIATLSNISVNQLKISELSGLAWDQDEDLLYALSDNGYVLHMRPVFSARTLQDVLLVSGYHLHDENGKPLKYSQADSEGLDIENGNNRQQGDTRLIVSFERAPRVIRYTPDGIYAAAVTLPPELAGTARYRSGNKALEAVTLHPDFGILTGPEIPLKDNVPGLMNIYSQHGDHWSFKAHNSAHGALVDLTTLPDGKIIALERVYAGLFGGIETTLHRIKLDGKQIQAEQIYTFTPEEGLFNDNFEGITHLGDNYFMMVSDDNNHPFKRTLLVYFEILAEE